MLCPRHLNCPLYAWRYPQRLLIYAQWQSLMGQQAADCPELCSQGHELTRRRKYTSTLHSFSSILNDQLALLMRGKENSENTARFLARLQPTINTELTLTLSFELYQMYFIDRQQPN